MGQPIGTSEESSPFTVGREPAGYRLVQAGRRTVAQNWSSDSFGDDEPVTVLAPAGGDGDPEGPGSVRVSLTGFEGFEGGLHQASPGYTGETSEDFEIDGQPAIVDPCLELADGSRAYPGAGSSTTVSDETVVVNVPPSTLEGGGDFPGFVVVMTARPAAYVRVQTTGEPVEIPMIDLPGGVRRGAAVVVEAELALDGPCGGVELEDSSGETLPCPSA